MAGFNTQVDNVGSGGNTVTAFGQDLVRLRFSATTYGAGTAVAAAVTMLDGDGDVRLDTAAGKPGRRLDPRSKHGVQRGAGRDVVRRLAGLYRRSRSRDRRRRGHGQRCRFARPGRWVLLIDLTVNGSPDDRLAIRNQGNGAGQIGVAGSNVSYGGVVIGVFDGGTDGSTPLAVTFSANATPAAVQACCAT